MSAGTITLTNGSAIVGGSGTTFTTELAAGDFIVSTVGGVPYTLPVKSVASNTQLTLVSNFTGPTQSGAAWSAVPRVALNMVTAALVAQSAEALRGLNYDKQNWQQVFSASGNLTVKLPDGTTFTGPSWNYLSTQFNSKLDTSGGTLTGQVNLRSAPIAADANSVISANGGLDVSMSKGFLLKGKVQNGAGNDNNILTITGDGDTPATGFVGAFQYNWYGDGWITGITRGSGTNTLAYAIYYNGASYGSGAKLWNFNYDGSATAQGAWVNGSDERHKFNITQVPSALAAVLSFRGVTYDIKDGGQGVGLIAQDVEKWCPDAVKTYGAREFSDGTVIEDFKFLDTSGVSAAYHTEAIKALFNLIDLALTDPDKARSAISEIKQAG